MTLSKHQAWRWAWEEEGEGEEGWVWGRRPALWPVGIQGGGGNSLRNYIPEELGWGVGIRERDGGLPSTGTRRKISSEPRGGEDRGGLRRGPDGSSSLLMPQ